MVRIRRLLDDCFLHDKDRLKHAEALKLLDERLIPVAKTEMVPLAGAYGRVLAEDVVALRPIPSFINAAVDGYAFDYVGLVMEKNRLKVVERVAAGEEPERPLESGEAARIFTGAMMPEGADTCIMQEDVTVEGDTIVVPLGLKPGANTRQPGEDVKPGQAVAKAGARLRPQELAAIAAAGKAEVRCFKPLRVALLSTGNEVVRPGSPLGRSHVFDSNHYMLTGLLATMELQGVDLGILRDDEGLVRDAVKEAAQSFDVVISTGGASRGEADFIVETIQSLGSLHAWQIAVKPGRPLAMGQVGDTVFFGLPGNPVAVFVTFVLYARPMLAKLQGAIFNEPRRFKLPAGFAIPKKKAGRREFWRGWIANSAGGVSQLQKFERDGSALITGLRQAEGLIEVPEEITEVKQGDLLDFIPFTEFGLPPR
jgi:molybdopterin molybdotransferase